METFLNLFLITAALGGFVLAFFIFISKRKAKPIACPLDGHCDDVVRSEFSKFFGVPVEILGMLYYAAAAAAYSIFYFYSGLAVPLAAFAMFGLASFSFLFSLYLTFIQAFNLKQWCVWCLASAGLSSFIFLANVFYVKLGFAIIPAEIFEEFYEILVAGHLLSAGLGFGASVVGAIMLWKFVKDLKMSGFEADILRTLTQVIWFSIFILILSGFGLYFSDEGISNVLYKSAIAAVLVLISAVLNLAILPKMVKKTLLFINNGENPVSSVTAKVSLVFNFLAVFIWLCVLIF
ncbi:MAG: Vitamin K epoxide reductase [Parcubacteria group bacterium GW2011_GWA2_47_64]|nr:MAG: Vitamin K epoxide reductase [Parcubacteria group bacterium GW2011_GWA2_47_64]